MLLRVEDHCRPLLRGKSMHRAPQSRHRLRLAHLITGIGTGCRLSLDERLLGIAIRVARDEPRPPATPTLVIQTRVDQDSIEPRREPGVTAKSPGRLPHANERFLRDVARVFGVAEQRPGQTIRPALMTRDKKIEGRVVTRRDPSAQRLIRTRLPVVRHPALCRSRSHSRIAGNKFRVRGRPARPRTPPPRRRYFAAWSAFRAFRSCRRSRRSWRTSRRSCRKSRRSWLRSRTSARRSLRSLLTSLRSERMSFR